MSWGYPGGEFSGETYYDGHCELARSVCVVASGDYGRPGEYPAYSPRTLAVGGTTLDLASDGTISSEVGWPGSGGGESYFEPKPPAQRGVVPGPRRGLPDVSFDADPNTGVAVYDSVPYQGQAGWFQVGGTSVGTPVWSAILSSADQLRAAAGKGPLTSAGDQAARAVYAATSALGDIITGPQRRVPEGLHGRAGLRLRNRPRQPAGRDRRGGRRRPAAAAATRYGTGYCPFGMLAVASSRTGSGTAAVCDPGRSIVAATARAAITRPKAIQKARW
jgi:hypothetical protein